MSTTADVIVIGSGVAGLTAARELARQGRSVVVLDKGRRAGGRLASRELATGAVADHGAQFFTARSPEMREAVASWVAAGAAREWFRGLSDADGHPRYAAAGGMARLAAHLARGLDVRQSRHVEALRRAAGGWEVRWPRAHGSQAGAATAPVVVLTPPLPQAAALLDGEGELPSTTYDSTISLALALDHDPAIPAPGAVRPARDATWSWIADNAAKGASRLPAATFHTRADIAASWWDRDPEQLRDDLLRAASPWLAGAEILDAVVHRWRYATPTDVQAERCLRLCDGSVVIAGEAFAGPRVEGAYLSGLAAANCAAAASG